MACAVSSALSVNVLGALSPNDPASALPDPAATKAMLARSPRPSVRLGIGPRVSALQVPNRTRKNARHEARRHLLHGAVAAPHDNDLGVRGHESLRNVRGMVGPLRLVHDAFHGFLRERVSKRAERLFLGWRTESTASAVHVDNGVHASRLANYVGRLAENRTILLLAASVELAQAKVYDTGLCRRCLCAPQSAVPRRARA